MFVDVQNWKVIMSLRPIPLEWGFCYPPRFVLAAKRSLTVGLGSGPLPRLPDVLIDHVIVGVPSSE